MTHRLANLTWQRALPYVLSIGAAIGLLASFALTYDKIHVLQNPSYQPGCNLNPVLSCGSVMKTEQASLLGVPNTIFGLMAFSMLLVFGLVLASGVVLHRWFWLGAQALATLGVIMMHYLFFEAVWRIHAICPWCFVVWMITIPIFFGITICNIRRWLAAKSRSGWLAVLARSVDRHSVDLFVLWYLVILGTLLVKFWYYWRTLL